MKTTTRITPLQKVLKWGIWIIAVFLILSLVLAVTGALTARKIWNGRGAGMMNNPSVVTQDFGFDGDRLGRSDARGMMNEGGMMNRKLSEGADRKMMSLGVSAPTMMSDGFAQAPEADKKIIKNGQLDIRVKSADETVAKLHDIAKKFSGEVASSNVSSYGNREKSGVVVVKVPVAEFDGAMREVRNIATQVTNENTSGSDVTAQYIDLSARLKNKRAQEGALQTLLGKAEKVGDVINVTRELGTVRGEIESLEGQLRYLSSQTDMATITISFQEDAKIASGNQGLRLWEVIKEAIQTLFGNLGKLAMGAIVFVIVGLPLILIYGALLYGIYKLVRKLLNQFFAEKK